VKRAASLAAILILALAATSAWAACPGACPKPAQVQCPQPCPQPVQCPQPCPQPVVECPKPCPPPVQCPAPCPPPCPASVPASIGAGPAGDLAGLQCPDFDPAYIRKVYQQNATIIAVTEFGMARAYNGNLRDISGEIRNRLVGANQKLAMFYQGCGCLTADPAEAQATIADLCNQSGPCFDVAYAKTLSALVKQSQAADELGAASLVNCQLKQQAQFMTGKECDWAFRLDRWVTDHGYTA
jgi:hypothetical protein